MTENHSKSQIGLQKIEEISGAIINKRRKRDVHSTSGENSLDKHARIKRQSDLEGLKTLVQVGGAIVVDKVKSSVTDMFEKAKDKAMNFKKTIGF